jgi:thiol:disulfide interchange protein/DsbC/DsbD-like thiol-disulfide interchange protein
MHARGAISQALVAMVRQGDAVTLSACLRSLLLLWAALMLPMAATAQDRTPYISALLVADGPMTSNGQNSIAIHMTPAPTWHGYWKNGGDAGFGMQVDWDLPPGVTVGELAYPVPETLIIGGLMNHVYERPYALIAPLLIDSRIAPGTRLTLRGQARWLACTDEICVPEQGTLTLAVVAGELVRDPRFAGWRAELPPVIDQPARYAVNDGRLRLAIPLPDSVALTAPHLFIEAPRINEPGGEQRFSRSGNLLIIDMPAGDDVMRADEWAGLLRLGETNGLAFRAVVGVVPAEGEAVATIAAAGNGGGTTGAGGGFDSSLFLSALLGAILGGVILNIMPCVFPILSLKGLALARAGGDERQVRAEGVAYSAGAVLTCAALGAALLALRAGGEALGWAFQLQRPESVVLLIVLMSAITANLAGLFDFGAVNLGFGRATAAARENSPTKDAFLTGALAAFIATPCTGPFLGAALGATLTLPAWAALPVFAGLGLGLALPFLALAFFPALRRRLPKPGPWMESFRRWLAVPMALTVVALVWLLGRQVGPTGWWVGAGTALAAITIGWWAGQRQRGGLDASMPVFLMVLLIVPAASLLPPPVTRSASTEADILDARPWSLQALADARGDGPVFVYFTADWCITCKVNENAAINVEATAAAFARAGVTTLVGDWTNADAAITAELARHQRNSVPLYLWYPAGGGEPELLPQILTPAMLAERAAR